MTFLKELWYILWEAIQKYKGNWKFWIILMPILLFVLTPLLILFSILKGLENFFGFLTEKVGDLCEWIGENEFINSFVFDEDSSMSEQYTNITQKEQ